MSTTKFGQHLIVQSSNIAYKIKAEGGENQHSRYGFSDMPDEGGMEKTQVRDTLESRFRKEIIDQRVPRKDEYNIAHIEKAPPNHGNRIQVP